jgi:peroxiredoxin
MDVFFTHTRTTPSQLCILIKARGIRNYLCLLRPPTGCGARDHDSLLKFNLLVDKDNEIGKAFGVVYTFPEDLKNVYLNAFKLDIQAVNEASVWQLPIPARFVIDGNGVIRDAKANPDYRYRPEPSEVLDIVKNL